MRATTAVHPDASRTAPAGLPTVTVCIPSLGRPSLTSVALPSLLAQGDHVHQVVVALHGADIEIGGEVLADPRVTVVRHTGPSVSGVRNAAAAAATGEALLFLDDDDALADGALAVLRTLLRDPGDRLAFGAAEILDQAGHRQEIIGPEDLGPLYHGITGVFLAGTFLVRRSLFDEVGGYNASLRFGENYDVGIRLAAAAHAQGFGCRWTPEVVVRCAPSGKPYRDERAEAAAFTLEQYPELLAELGEQRATLHAILGVYRWRCRDRPGARRHLVAAVRARPSDPRHWARLLLSCVRPVADRRWTP